MLLDGKCINIVNIWRQELALSLSLPGTRSCCHILTLAHRRKHNISAGDSMILVLRKMIPNDYVLSRQTGSYNRQRFSDLPGKVYVEGTGELDLENRRAQGVWQLVPWVYNMADEPDNPTEYDYRENG